MRWILGFINLIILYLPRPEARQLCFDLRCDISRINLTVSYIEIYYMSSDHVFSEWLKSLVITLLCATGGDTLTILKQYTGDKVSHNRVIL
jgi:hypothetical protein